MNQQASIRHLRIAISLVLGVLALGIVGYMLIEHFSFIDALFTTVDMMSTVGITAHALSNYGRLFTIMIIILGVGSLFYTFGVIMEFIIEGHFSQAIGRFFISSRRRHTSYIGDWSSDVCSSDLANARRSRRGAGFLRAAGRAGWRPRRRG